MKRPLELYTSAHDAGGPLVAGCVRLGVHSALPRAGQVHAGCRGGPRAERLRSGRVERGEYVVNSDQPVRGCT